ncbi:nitrate- and nitrite sensing domain-containing protein [Nocardia sp. NPDC004068]|uniref:sensor histidine kinase n=1 Tax=Nocardia sp. NPDC004068 TaxID=3364303 RepID=UPI0036B66526
MSLPRIRFRPPGIRARVLAIALVPGAALFLVCTVTVAALTAHAATVRDWSGYRATVIEPLLGFVGAVQDERTASMLTVARAPAATADLRARREALDAALAETVRISASAQHLDGAGISRFSVEFGALISRLPAVRQAVDGHTTNLAEVDDFYTRLVAAIADGGQESTVHTSPDNALVAAEVTGTALLRASDTHARMVAHIAAGLVDGPLDPAARRTVTQLEGGYRQQLDMLAPHLLPEVEAEYRELTRAPEWSLLDGAHAALAADGTLPLPADRWLAAERTVRAHLVELLRHQYRLSVAASRDIADHSFNRTLAVGTAIVLATLVAVAFAVLLANRLVRRLRALRAASLAMARDGLPAILARLHRGETVDVSEASTAADRGADEIGELADAFAIAQRTAIDAAVGEARTREGFNKVFLDIAFRSQALVRRQLDVLDVAEAEQLDPEHLEMLFRLDHLATRARRNAENLLILGGRQPGRRWREPVGLEEIVRGAAAETEGFARVHTVRLPVAGVVGPAVADLLHLLAELIDNAATFSPPECPITVHGTMAGRGLVVEIVDQGLGIVAEERGRLNEMLREPPEFHEMALAGRRQLGMFVVSRLAARHDISVRLTESVYGGITAIALLPWDIIDRDAPQIALPPDRIRAGLSRGVTPPPR